MLNVQCSIKNRVRADDLVKTPVSHDKGAPCCCNPPALLLSRRIIVARHWQGKQSSMRHDPYICVQRYNFLVKSEG